MTSSNDDYTFSTDETGTTTARGMLYNQNASRNGMGKAFHGKDMVDNDHKGHLVAARFNGEAKAENLYAQNRDVNLIDFKNAENLESRAIKNGDTIETERTAYISHGSRPDNFMINDTVTHPNGQVENIHFSFTNESHADLEQYNEISRHYLNDDYPNPEDTLRESMSTEEYAELVEETDNYLPSISDEYDGGNYHYFPDVQDYSKAETSEVEVSETEVDFDGLGDNDSVSIGCECESDDGGS